MDLKASKSSSPSGKASIIENQDKVNVMIFLANPSTASLSAQLYLGTCSQLGKISNKLNPLSGGRSDTIIETSFDNLISQAPVAVVVTRNSSKTKVYDFCADLKQ